MRRNNLKIVLNNIKIPNFYRPKSTKRATKINSRTHRSYTNNNTTRQEYSLGHQSRSRPRKRKKMNETQEYIRNHKNEKIAIPSKVAEIISRPASRESIPPKYHKLLIALINKEVKIINFGGSKMGDEGLYFICYYCRQYEDSFSLGLKNC